MLKFKFITVTFVLGVIVFFAAHLFHIHINYWYLIIWVNLFLIIQFFGAYFIGLNFHLTSINQLKKGSEDIVLTFDDGPHPKYTTTVLSVLKKHNIKAIFFIIGKNISGNEQIVQQIVSDGHKIGNHSFSHHAWIDLWSTKKVTEDFDACQKLIEVYQPDQVLFRPPYGVTNPNIAHAVAKLKLRSIGWNVRSYDTSIKDITKINERILLKLKPGSIILLHDRLSFMPELLDELIPKIKQKGYSFTNTL